MIRIGGVILGVASIVVGMHLAAAGADRPIVAVFKIEDKSGAFSSKVLESATDYLAAELGKAGVFQVVPPGDIKRALTQKKQESQKECFDQQCQIELGRELAAGKTLSVTISKIGTTCTFSASLYDLKKMATDATSTAKGSCTGESLLKSVEQMATEIRAWSSGGRGTSGFQEGKIGGTQEAWTVGGGDEVLVEFNSTPAGATVLLDGNLLCQKAPCRKSVTSGAHEVAIQAERYEARRERMVLTKGSRVDWTLKPNFGWLTVRSSPPGLEVKVNGESSGKTPIEKREVSPGGYEVVITSPCHQEAGERVKIERGQEKEVSVEPQGRLGAIKVKARDKDGNDLEADVLVDGAKIGTTPGTFKVSVCSREVEIRHASQGAQKRSVQVKEREVVALEAELKGEPAGQAWVYSKPARMAFTRSEITVGEYRECVKTGRCSLPIDKNANKYCNWGYPDRDDHPINCVDRNQANAFCRGIGGRLPTNEEWYAEASGWGPRVFPWGNQEVTCEYAVWSEGGNGCGKNSTWPVCSKPRGNSVSGLCDMSGNLWEWTNSGTMRGGSWFEGTLSKLRVSSRFAGNVDSWYFLIGFRCARSSK